MHHTLKWLAVTLRKREPRAPVFEVAEGESGQWHYRERAANGRIMLTSETYFSKSNAHRAAVAVAFLVPGSVVRVMPSEPAS